MLRLAALTWMCLGLVVSCGPAQPEGAASGASSSSRAKLAALAVGKGGPVPLAAQIQVAPLMLNFGNQKRGTVSAPLSVRVWNTGTSRLGITALPVNPPSSYTTSPSGAFSVPIGGYQDILVKFIPAAVGLLSGTLTVVSDAGNVTVALTGSGVESAAEVSPSSLAFGEAIVNGAGVDLPVTVRNAGNAVLQIAPFVTGPSAASFVFTPATASVLVGETRTFIVSFRPQVPGPAAASLGFTTDEPEVPRVPTVALTGTGLAPSISVPPALAFGDQQVNTSMVRTLTVSNVGTGTLTISNIARSGPGAGAYSFTPSTLSVPAGESRDVTVAFKPTSQGQLDAALTLSTNDVAQPTVTVTLSGRGIDPIIAVPNAMAFGDQQVNGTATLELIVGNAGTGTLNITSITKGGTGAALYHFTPSTLSVPEGQSRPLTVTFSPTSTGATTATLTLTTNAVSSPSVAVTLTGRGVNPIISVPSSVAFGDQQVGGSASTRSLTVSNTGTGTLNIASIIKGGTGAALYSFTPSTLSVPEGQSRDVLVTFSPTIQGTASATLTLVTNDVAHSTVSVALSGRGISPIIAVPASLAFNEQQVNTSVQKTLTVSNSGTGTLTISNIARSGPGAGAYSFTPSTLSVPEAQSASLTVTFSPTSQGPFNATLTLTTNDVTHPTVTVALSGQGINPSIQVPSTLAFGEVQANTSATRVLTVTNSGTGTLTVSSITQGGSGAALYSFTPSTLSVPAGESRNVSVTFSPTSTGAASATLTLASNDVAHATSTVTLSGRGVSPSITVPATLTFGDLRVGDPAATKTLTVTNSGTGTLTVSSITRSGPDAAAYSVTPSTLSVPEGQSQNLTVTFNPSHAGQADATLTLNTNDVARSTVSVALSGRGISPSIVLSASLIFSEQQVSTSAQQQLTVSNTGTGTLTLSNITKSGSGAGAYSFSPSTLSVPEGQTQSLTVVFSPTSEGPADATLTLTTNDTAHPTVTVTLSGRGINPTLSVPSTLDFGTQRVGTHTTRPLTVSNVGSGTLTIRSVILSGSGAASYTATPSTLTVPAGESRELQVTFSPSANGPVSATLSLANNSAASPNVTMTLAGVGESVPGLQLSATQLDFGNVLLGNPSAPRVLTLTSNGTGPLIVSALSLEGADAAVFALQGPALPVSLQPATSVDLAVTLRPDAERQFSALLRVQSNDPASPSVALPLTGNGIRQPIHVSESTLDFGQQLLHTPSSPRKVRVVNGSGGPATLSALVVEGEGASQFTVGKPSLPLVLAAGQEQELEVSFTPSVAAEVSGTLTAVFSDPVLQLPVALQGQGVSSVLTVTPSVLDFGSLEVNEPSEPQAVTLVNTSSQEQHVVVKLKDPEGSPFSVDTAALAPPIPPGGSTTFQVTFLPTAVGDAQNEVQVWVQGAPEASGRIAVRGIGTEPQGGCSCGSTEPGRAGLLALLTLLALGWLRWRDA